MAEVLYTGKVDGQFYGFNANTLFKMKDGSYWMQEKSEYWYYYASYPDAIITKEKETFLLTVAGNSIPVRKVTDLIESQIDGDFFGWDGNSVYKLVNGQTWKQRNYLMEFKAVSQPEAVIFLTSSGLKMTVAGTTADVEQVVE